MQVQDDKPYDDINITPMLDLAYVLLVIFILGAILWEDMTRPALFAWFVSISLVTVGRFAPALGLRGSAVGPIRVRGSLNDLAVRADLRLPDGGELLATARLDVEGTPAYDARAALRVFNLNTVASALPRTSLTGSATIRGTGADLGTMRATIAAREMSSAVSLLITPP